jgi:hypothetical protein
LGKEKNPESKVGTCVKTRCRCENQINDGCSEKSAEHQNARGLEEEEGSGKSQDKIKGGQGSGKG